MNRRITALVLFVAAFVVLAILLPKYVSLEVLIKNEERLRSAVRDHPLRTWIFGLATYFLFSLIPGTSGKSVVCGWIFGFWQALLMVDLALTAAAIVMFLASRYVLRNAVEARFAVVVEWLRQHLERDGPFYLLFVRFAHAPFSVVNAACGVLAVRTRTFAWTTLCGLVPGSAIFVFAGTQLPTLRELKDHGVTGLFDTGLIAALIATALAPICVRLGAGWITDRFRRGSCVGQ